MSATPVARLLLPDWLQGQPLTAGPALALSKHQGSGAGSEPPREQPSQLLPQQERSDLVVSSWRTYLSGFHNGPNVHFDQLDPEEYIAKVRAAHSQVVMVFCKDHWGYAYYDTKVGVRHPNLRYDLIARWVELGHRNGLAVSAYYSGQLDTQSGLKYPEWIGRNADGSPSWVGRHFAWCCHNSPYRDYALGMYRELFTQYEFDGLFIDGIPFARWLPEELCYCAWCMQAYERDRGESFLAGLETQPGYRKRLDWLQQSTVQYLDEVYQVVRKEHPGLPIYFNNAGPFELPTEILSKACCLFLEGHDYDSASGASTAAAVLRDWQKPAPQVLVYWGGYSGTPIEVDKFRTAAIILQGAHPMMVTDQQNMPDGRQRDGFFEWAGQLQEYVGQVEPFLQNLEPITSLGIFFSEATREHLVTQRLPELPADFGSTELHDSIVGCFEILTRTQYPVGIISPQRLKSEDLQGYDAIILPETDAMSEDEARALRNYVAKGGKLLASWKPGLIDEHGQERSNFLLADVLGVNYEEVVEKYTRRDGPGMYFQSSGHPLSAFLGSGVLGILMPPDEGWGVLPPGSSGFCAFVRVHGPAESLLDYRLPYMVPDLDHHRVDSWNSAPPGNEKIPQAATIHRYGEGRAVYMGVPIFRAYQTNNFSYTLVRTPIYWVDEFVRRIVKELAPNPAVRIEGDRTVQAAFYRQGTQQLIVQIVNGAIWAIQDKAPAARDVEIVGRSDLFPIRSARLLWPTEQTLNVTKGQSWRVQVPPVELHSIVRIELG